MKIASKSVSLLLMGWAGLGLVCQAALAVAPPTAAPSPAQTESRDKAGLTDLGLGLVADFPKEVTEGFKALLQGGSAADPGLGTFARPLLGALSARSLVGNGLDGRLKIPGAMDSLLIPEVFSVVIWVRLEKEQRSNILFGFGEPDGDYLVAATDANGALSLAFLNHKMVSQVDRAHTAPVNLADSRLHAVVAVVNLGSGLARLYVDGKPEAASTISMWRPRQFGFAFASYSLQGQMDVPGIESVGLLMPRVVMRELTEEEIAKIKPGEGEQDPEMAGIDKELGARLTKDTLVEFWPSHFGYMLKRRPGT